MGSIPYSPDTGVIVTGAASGIGRACALALAEAGRGVACWDLDGDGARATSEAAARCGVPASWQKLDVRETAAFPAAITAARGALGSLGGLVHAAGVAGPTPIEELDEQSWARVLDVNLRAEALLVRALLPDLRAQPGSAVVGIASIDALVGHAIIPAYNASKSGLLGLTRSLADALAEQGIRVNAVCPGYIDTPMLAPVLERGQRRMLKQVPLGRLGQPVDIARAVRFLMSDDAAYITGEHLVVDGGLIHTLR
jgi:NAD(P)-dependent dehydrogenase (short-subunit alcohol dehydrogenase family)